MALLTSEIIEVRTELGYNAMGVGAEPYVQYFGVFDQVVQTYLSNGAATTTSTVVVAAPSPTAATLTLASATGVHQGDLVIVDVDSLQEEVTVQAVSGSTITALLTLGHTGTYPVTVDGGEGIVRRILRAIRAIKKQLSNPTTLLAIGAGGLKKVDEIEFHASMAKGYSSTMIGALRNELAQLRDELASVLGVTNLRRLRQGQSRNLVNY